MVEYVRQPDQLLAHVRQLEDRLARRKVGAERARDKVSEMPGVGDRRGIRAELLRQLLAQAEQPLEQHGCVSLESLDLDRLLVALLHNLDVGCKVRLLLSDPRDSDALYTLHGDHYRAVRAA